MTAAAIVVAACLSAAHVEAVDTAAYQAPDSTPEDPNLGSLDQYLGNSILVSPLGMALRGDRRELKSGAAVTGLLIVRIRKGSPAAEAGLDAVDETAKNALVGVAMAATVAFPPAMLALPFVALMPIGHQGDLIVAVDSARVSNLVDFEDQTSQVQPGEIVYLTVVRSGTLAQVRVQIPAISR